MAGDLKKLFKYVLFGRQEVDFDVEPPDPFSPPSESEEESAEETTDEETQEESEHSVFSQENANYGGDGRTSVQSPAQRENKKQVLKNLRTNTKTVRAKKNKKSYIDRLRAKYVSKGIARFKNMKENCGLGDWEPIEPENFTFGVDQETTSHQR